MNSVLDESKVEQGAEVGGRCAATCCREDTQEVAKRIEKGMNDVNAAVSAKLEGGKRGGWKRDRYEVEDGINETAHKMKRRPFSFFAIAFAAGALLSFLLPRFAKK